MANNINGFGKIGFREATTGIWRPLRADNFVIGSEKETEQVLSYPANECGPLVAVDTKAGSTTWTVGVSINSIDNTDLEVLFNQKFATTASIGLPTVDVYTIPASTPYTVSIAGIDTALNVAATILNDDAASIPLEAGTASATEFTIGTDALTFDVTYAGKSVSVYRRVAQTSVEVMGGTNPVAELGELELFGVGCMTRSSNPFKIWLPRIKVNGGVNFDAGADTFETTYDALVPAGFNHVFAIW